MKEIVLYEDEDWKRTVTIDMGMVQFLSYSKNAIGDLFITDSYTTSADSIKKTNQAIEEGE